MTAPTPRPQIDTSRPHPARVYDWMLGGKDNYPVDRAVGEKLPPFVKPNARQNRAFMHRATRWQANADVTQFLDIGTGIPTEPNLHQIAQEINPPTRIVYVDNDPIVLAHAQALLVSNRKGSTHYIQADVRDPGAILDQTRKHLDFDRPIGLSLIALMHFIPDSEDPLGIIDEFLRALAPGSYLALSHGSLDLQPEDHAQTFAAEYKKSGITLQPRSEAEIRRLFDGLELVEPGLVLVPEWHPELGPVVDIEPGESGTPAIFGGVGRIPDLSIA